MEISRRRFLTSAGAAVVTATGTTVAGLPLIGGKAVAGELPGVGEFFTQAERQAAGVLADKILPPGEGFPGAQAAGAVAYIEAHLTAFEQDPPRIFAAGPFSGRTPYSSGGVPTQNYPPDSFTTFLPLTRSQEAGWRLRLYGDGAKQVGLRDLIKKGLDQAITLGLTDATLLLQIFEGKFWSEFTRLVIEGSLSAPEYGGNADLVGWKLASYAGDAQPLGYSMFDADTGVYHERSDAPISTSDTGVDPKELGFQTRFMLGIFAIFSGGKIYS